VGIDFRLIAELRALRHVRRFSTHLRPSPRELARHQQTLPAQGAYDTDDPGPNSPARVRLNLSSRSRVAW
jgi:hypothetical protein